MIQHSRRYESELGDKSNISDLGGKLEMREAMQLIAS